MRDRRMRSGTELAREIQLTYCSAAGEQGKLIFEISASHHCAIYFAFRNGTKSSFIRPNYTSIEIFHLKIPVKKKRRKGISFDKVFS